MGVDEKPQGPPVSRIVERGGISRGEQGGEPEDSAALAASLQGPQEDRLGWPHRVSPRDTSTKDLIQMHGSEGLCRKWYKIKPGLK